MIAMTRTLSISIAIIVLITRLVRADEQIDPRNETFWGSNYFEQRVLHIALQEANKNKNQLFIAFSDKTSSCDAESTQDFSFIDFRMKQDGIIVSGNGGRLHYKWEKSVFMNDHTLKIKFIFKNCSMDLVLSRLEKTGDDWNFQTVDPSQTRDDIDGEKGFNRNGQSLNLSFQSSSAQNCPMGAGSIYLFSNALISDFGRTFKGLVKHVGRLETTDTFTIGNTTCRYVMTISHEIHSILGNIQQPVLDLSFGEYK